MNNVSQKGVSAETSTVYVGYFISLPVVGKGEYNSSPLSSVWGSSKEGRVGFHKFSGMLKVSFRACVVHFREMTIGVVEFWKNLHSFASSE